MYSETAVRISSNQMTDEGFDQRCTLLSHLSYVPGDSSGDGGTRTHKHRLDRHVLRNGSQDVLKSNDRRSCDQRCTLLSHLSYTPEESSGGGGARTHNPRISNHVLQSAVGHVSSATKVGQSYPLPSERRLPKTVGSGGGRNRTMYSNPAVAVVFKSPTKDHRELLLYSAVRVRDEVADR